MICIYSLLPQQQQICPCVSYLKCPYFVLSLFLNIKKKVKIFILLCVVKLKVGNPLCLFFKLKSLQQQTVAQ